MVHTKPNWVRFNLNVFSFFFSSFGYLRRAVSHKLREWTNVFFNFLIMLTYVFSLLNKTINLYAKLLCFLFCQPSYFISTQLFFNNVFVVMRRADDGMWQNIFSYIDTVLIFLKRSKQSTWWIFELRWRILSVLSKVLIFRMLYRTSTSF